MTLMLILQDYYLLAPLHSYISIKFGTVKCFSRGHAWTPSFCMDAYPCPKSGHGHCFLVKLLYFKRSLAFKCGFSAGSDTGGTT